MKTVEQINQEIIALVKKTNSTYWVEGDGMFFEDEEVAVEYYTIFHYGFIEELAPINADDIVDYACSVKDIITADKLAEMIKEQEEEENEGMTYQEQWEEDMRGYYQIVRQGLGL